MTDRIIEYIRAGFAGIWLVTREEARAEAALKAAADTLGWSLYSWSVTAGLVNTAGGSCEPVTDPVQAAEHLTELPEQSILVLKDYHQFLGDSMQPADPLITRTLKEQLRLARCSARVAVILGCRLQMPPELEKEFTVLEGGLPGIEDLEAIAEGIAAAASMLPAGGVLEAAAQAARGLTTSEAEDVMALTVVRGKPLDPVMIAAEKARAVKKGGLLEFVETDASLDDVGGLTALKQWLLRRRRAFGPEAAAFGLPVPRGVLLTGIPGTGKSLTAKVAASVLGKPLLRLDAGRLFAGIVGESEANLRRAIETAEAVAPCILWIEELEKSMSGSRSSGSTDGGTGARVFGSFLSWMQEKTSPVFVVATANDVSQLPPELLRKGRMDELFFCDLPGEAERDSIWRIHIAKRKRDPELFDVTALVRLSDGFTGAEIEQAFIDALYEAFDEGREVVHADVAASVTRSVPLSVTMAEEIQAMRKWASKRARSAAGDGVAVSNERRLSVAVG